MHPIRILAPREHTLYGQHLLRLSAADRRLRFGFSLDDAAVEAYVGRLAAPHDRVLAHFNDELTIVAGGHIAFCHGDVVELAFSVDTPHRGRGLGAALMARAVIYARNRGARSAHTYCLVENREMRRLARHAGMGVNVAGGESEGELTLPAATPLTFASEVLCERAALRDYGAKSSRQIAHLWHRDLSLAA